MVKPKLGEKSSMVCYASNGSPPFEFNWYKDDGLITNSDVIRIDKLRDSSILNIDSMSSSFNGNYSCRVTNSFGSDSLAITLTVDGKLFN